MTTGMRGLLPRILLSASLAIVSVASFGSTKTTAEANKSAYDAYNNNTAPETVTVTGIVVSQPKRYDAAATPKLAQDGISFSALVIQDSSANRVIGGTLYSNAIKVLLGGNYGPIPAGTTFPLSLADRQTYGYPKEGDLVTVTGAAKISWDTISAVFPLTIADEAVIDIGVAGSPKITITSENNVVTPLSVTPSTFTSPPFSKLADSSVAGLLDLHSRKGVQGFGQGNIVPNPLCGMLVTLNGSKWDMLNPKNTQPSYLNGKVGFLVADTGASSTTDAATVFVNSRPALGTGETPIPIDASLLSPGSTDPVTGIVNSHLLIAGTKIWNVAGVAVRRQNDIPNSGGPSNSVSFVTESQPAGSAPIPGGQVDLTVTGLEALANKGLATITADLAVLGDGGATDLSNNPIADVTLTPTSPGSNTYKGSFKIASPARKGYLTPTIHYVNTGTDIFINSSTAFSPVLNAVPYSSAAALHEAMDNLPDGFPVAIDASIPGTVSPIVTANEASGAAYLGSSAKFFVEDPYAPAGLNIFMPDGNKATPKTLLGDAVSFAGTLTTFSGQREITSQIAFVKIESSNNTVPAPVFMNTNDVSADFNDTNFNGASQERVPASRVPNQWTLATIVGKVTGITSSLLTSNFPQQIDIDDGSGPIVAFIDNRYTDAKGLLNLREFAAIFTTQFTMGATITFTRTSAKILTLTGSGVTDKTSLFPVGSPVHGTLNGVSWYGTVSARTYSATGPTFTLTMSEATPLPAGTPVNGDTLQNGNSGATLMLTGLCAANTRTISGVVTTVRTFWILDEKSVIKSPTLNPINVTVPGGTQLVTLPAPADPQLQNATTIIPAGLGAQRLFEGTLYSGAPAGSDPWWKGYQFLRVGEAYKITGTPANFSYQGFTSGSGTALDGSTQNFDMSTLGRFYSLYNSTQDQLVGISYTGNSVLWDEDGPANQFYGYDGGALESMFGVVSTTINTVKDDSGSAVAAPHTFNAGTGARVAETANADNALVLFPTAVNNTSSITVTIQPEALFSGSIAGYPVEVQIRYPGSTTPIMDINDNFDGSGLLTISNIPAGVYDVWIHACGFLADTITGVTVLSTNPGGTLTAMGQDQAGVTTGDAAMTNQIGLFSINAMLLDFGVFEGCPVDADGDGQVNLGDLNIALLNFGKSGTP